jgi:hypothetical protein
MLFERHKAHYLPCNMSYWIGSSNIKSDESHPSISKIIANTPDIENLVFHDIKEDFIIKQINKINKKSLDFCPPRQICHKNMFLWIVF